MLMMIYKKKKMKMLNFRKNLKLLKINLKNFKINQKLRIKKSKI